MAIAYILQLQQLIQETGLSKSQIMNYRRLLEGADIFPSHKGARDIYLPEETDTLLKIGTYIQSGIRPLASIRLAVGDVYGAHKVADFNSGMKEYNKRNSEGRQKRRLVRRLNELGEGSPTELTPSDYNTLARAYDGKLFALLSKGHPVLLDKLVEQFFTRKMVEYYPLNLYFALTNIDPEGFVRPRLESMMTQSVPRQNFEEYRNDVFSRFMHSLNGLSDRLIGILDIVGSQTGINQQQTAAIRRDMEIIKSLYIEKGKLRFRAELAQEEGVERERIRQLEARAFKRLRTYEGINALTEELFS